MELGAICETAGRSERPLKAPSATPRPSLTGPTPWSNKGPYTREEIDGQAAETYERLGRLCLQAGRTDQAVAAFQQAQKKDPARAARLSYNLAEVYAGQGKSREALERLDEYLQTQPQGVEGYELKIKLQRKLGRDDAVVPDLEAASGHDRQNAALHSACWPASTATPAATPTPNASTSRWPRTMPSPDIYRGLFDLYKAEPRRRRPYPGRPGSRP